MRSDEPSSSVSPPDDSAARRTAAFDELCRIIARLRGPNGCPWDREQTHATLRKYLIEETYETVDAIDAADLVALRDELGDVLLQIMLHSRIAEEAGEFTVADVIEGLSAKMIRRHPHVFGDASVAGSEEVVRNWDAIKAAERPEGSKPHSLLDGVPSSMPALARAMEISRRAARAGFEWERLDDVWAKVREELAELEQATAAGAPREIAGELGDLLFTLVNVARWVGADPEEALHGMLRRFVGRFQHMESRLAQAGRSMAAVSPAEWDALWTEAKSLQPPP